MRISTSMIYESGVARISDLQAAALKTQQQISTGHRVLTPADDPIAAARALEVTQDQSINTQLTTNRKNANDSLSLEESVLQNVTGMYQDVKTLIVNAGNGTVSDSERTSMATALSGQLDELMGLANSQDGSGNYIFSGYQLASPPFVTGAGGVTYNGDQGQRMLQVSPSQQMATGDTGDQLFQSIKNGNGSFITAAQSTVTAGGVVLPLNTGSGVISAGTVTNPVALTGHNYEVDFAVAGGVTTYSVVDTTSSTTLSSANPYTPGQTIAVAGMQFDISGAPADTDKFTVQPSANQSVFTIINNLINTLKAPATGATGQANLTNGLNAANTGIDRALDNVLTIRASIGSRMNELDALDTLGTSRDFQFTSTLGDLQDVDYAQAISTLNAEQTTLQAAQKSFVQVTSLSLFSLL